MYNTPNNQSGLATIPTVMALSMFILAAGVGIAALSFSDNIIGGVQKNTSQAYVYAEAGARDALIRLTRNRDYACASTDCYSIDMVTSGCSTNDGCARVQVTNTSSPATIVAKGQVKTFIRKVQVSVTYDSNGEITGTTWTELTN